MRLYGPMRAWPIVAALQTLLLVTVWVLWRSAVARRKLAEAALHRAIERRDRFLVTAARELEVPLRGLREELAQQSTRPDRAGVQELLQRVDALSTIVTDLAGLPPVRLRGLEEVDLAEVVREITSLPPFSEEGPPVIVRATPAVVRGDRGRLRTGLRLLLWVVRREADPRAPVVITLSQDRHRALLEIDVRGAPEAAEAIERLPAVEAGIPVEGHRPSEATLILRVASQVVRQHGGRLGARAPRGQGARFVLELPRAR